MNATSAPLSRFTPSLMPHAQLERLFVARERTLDAIIARIRTAADSTSRNHTLLVGPRGAGKTHLIALAYHRASALRADGLPIQVSWLPEDAWTIVSYRHLLTSIVDRLEPPIESPTPRGTDELEALIASRAESGGPIIVFVENLDQILAAIGNHGQQQLRHLLQSTRAVLLVATSTRLARNLSDQNAPFYGFFTTTRLEPLTVEQAASMLTRIAQEHGDEALAAYLETPEGLARLRTITHLAGGQPRMWAILAAALTVDRLGELVELLLTRFDDLTPYYQEQLGRLSPHQRLIVAELAEADRPLNVRTLAERLEIDQRSLAKTIVDLVDRGWVEPTASQIASLLDKRRTYYELAEPLARISFQLKDARGEPLRVIVDFLKNWFDPDELDAGASEVGLLEYVAMATRGHDSDPVVAVTRRLHRLPLTRCPAVELLAEIDDALAALHDDDGDLFLRLPTPARAALEQRMASPDDDIPSVRLEIHRAAQDEFGDVPHPSTPAWITRAEQLVESAPASNTTEAQRVLAVWLQKAWRFTDAEAVLAAVAESIGPDHPRLLQSRDLLASAYDSAGDVVRPIPLFEQTLADRERVLGPDHPSTLTSRNNLASAYESAGELARAIPLAEQTLADSERVLGPDHPSTLTSRNNLAGAYHSAGDLARAIPLFEQTLADRERVLGPDHPGTLASRNNLAAAYESAGDLVRAIPLAEQTLADSERVLGPDHPGTLTSRNNLAYAYEAAADLGRAIPLAEQTLADSERVLGPDHPSTLTSRRNLARARGADDNRSDAT
jgi:tetratricopeptide (TPR) repeat protein